MFETQAINVESCFILVQLTLHQRQIACKQVFDSALDTKRILPPRPLPEKP